MTQQSDYDVIVIGGGPSGATAANDLAVAGHRVLLLDKGGRVKPCGGAVPPRLLKDFDIPASLLVARARAARIIAPSNRTVTMPVGDGFVGMVDREHFDEWLRARAVASGAERLTATCEAVASNADELAVVSYRQSRGGEVQRLTARAVIGADGARSLVARQCLADQRPVPCVFAYHEIVAVPDSASDDDYQADRCDVFYQGHLSPDFYAWVFPHGRTASIGLGSANKGFGLREATKQLREQTGLDTWKTLRCEGAPIPLKPRKRWDNGRNMLVAGDAAGVVAPSSGEGIYYAMTAGRMSASATGKFLQSGDARALGLARKSFMKAHGRVFWILGVMQYFWYKNDQRRERFVKMCADPDVQRLTWEAYMNKELVRRDPAAHVRIFFKDLGHLLGLRAVQR